ncbi:phosphoglycerate mutase [Mycoplasma testudineum]|uniref:2,3-bisphosphoglycerate-independent phosphoglycerate mutase n=1 Tax=Mycoplasma testudineum TaxID=244584 RepID=A0A4R6IDP9_9MOLU|nr:2,3-bisphosphoglycerate-independent phosphoglycerate mutase [Mycoplasma testudineum]OYD26696.1 phosphoglycerate mutase (2,3-diphosphoglycerate-independent) [Mycoplasma testudineum]TDO19826.1 phosphoglycerate mutase [Mycoplasma testudineum]
MKKVILVVIDGLGLRTESQGNGFKQANTPNFDNWFKTFPNSKIMASGEYVGLPKGQMGNSEVGHLSIGAGKVVYTGLSLINNEIETGKFKLNEKFLNVFEKVKKDNSTLHIMGLLSPGGVHSAEEHLFELIKMAHEHGVKNLAVHVFGDGRDVAPQSIIPSIEKLDKLTKKFGYFIGTISGRFYAMDRDKIFERTQKAYDALLHKNSQIFSDAKKYVEDQYSQNITDEFFIPAYNPDSFPIKNNDSIIFFNFRPDRARQLTHLFKPSEIYDFKNSHQLKISNFISMMKYEGMDTEVAFEETKITEPIGKVLADQGLKQLRVAETQKYAHVTYFMDGGIDVTYPNSKRIMVDSIKAESFADSPHMSAMEITDEVIKNANNYDLTILNYANPDMVGHTGDLKATIEAVSFLDIQLGRLMDFAIQNNITVFITADHGNAEITEDENNQPATKHTSSPVMLITNDLSLKLKDGKLANIAPTILDYMNIKKPSEMNEESLIIK